MKKILSLFAIIALSVSCFIGCTTTGGNNIPAENALITAAASTGTELALQSQPKDAIYFIGAAQALQTVSTGSNAVTVATVEAALQTAGVTNVVVASAIENAITIGDSFIQNAGGTNSSAQFATLQVVCGDIATGIQQGLALSGHTTLKKK